MVRRRAEHAGRSASVRDAEQRGRGVAAATCSNRSHRAAVRIERQCHVALERRRSAAAGPALRGDRMHLSGQWPPLRRVPSVAGDRLRTRFPVPVRPARCRGLSACVLWHGTATRAASRTERCRRPRGGIPDLGGAARCRVHAAHRGNEAQRVTGCTSCHRWMAAKAASQGRTCACAPLPMLVRQPPVWALTIVTMSWDTGCRRQRWRRPA